METVQLINITPEQLKVTIVEGIKVHLEGLKESYQPKAPRQLMTRQEVADF